MSKRMYRSEAATTISKLPKRDRVPEHDERGQSTKGIAVCPRCHNVLYKKEWHHPTQKALAEIRGARHALHLKLCPACKMIKEGLFEGEVIIERVPEHFRAELAQLIVAQNAKAQQRDPQDRIINIEKRTGGFRVTTTDDQFAVKLAKKIKQVFNKVAVEISHSKEPYKVIRVQVRFQ